MRKKYQTKFFYLLYLLLLQHSFLLYFFLLQKKAFFFYSILLFALSVSGILFHIFPVIEKRNLPMRIKVMEGGRILIYCGLSGLLLQALESAVYFLFHLQDTIPAFIFTVNGIIATVFFLLLLVNGVLRLFFTSRRLSIVRRVVMIFTMWVPIVNILILLYACRLVYEEYQYACERTVLRELRVGTELCKTKYPLLLVHGIGFRDLRYFNYWGRIPAELMRNGAVIYYANQEALGTIEENAKDICTRIMEIRQEIGCEKVNIIAHSKGGLDARYAVSVLGMDQYTASMTLIGVPHQGCFMVERACKLPDSFYRFIARCFDRTFQKFGDKHPDFYTSTRQLSVSFSKLLQETVLDSPLVYYQSYASVMNGFFSDVLLGIPFFIVKRLEGENDGLVSTESAKWGEFRELFKSPCRRGISHGDLIDLKREDFKGFDARETYIRIVSDLKQRGY